MDNEDMFDSQVRSSGDLAGVFEFDGETGYFYLYDSHAPDNRKVMATIHIITGKPEFSIDDLRIQWDASENWVALFIGNQLWAVFDSVSKIGYGGNYVRKGISTVPPNITNIFS